MAPARLRFALRPQFSDLAADQQDLLLAIRRHAVAKAEWPSTAWLAVALGQTEKATCRLARAVGADVVAPIPGGFALTLKALAMLPDNWQELLVTQAWLDAIQHARLASPLPAAIHFDPRTPGPIVEAGDGFRVVELVLRSGEVESPQTARHAYLFCPGWARTGDVKYVCDLLFQTIPLFRPKPQLTVEELIAELHALGRDARAHAFDRRRTVWVADEFSAHGSPRDWPLSVRDAFRAALAWSYRDFSVPTTTRAGLDELLRFLDGRPSASRSTTRVQARPLEQTRQFDMPAGTRLSEVVLWVHPDVVVVEAAGKREDYGIGEIGLGAQQPRGAFGILRALAATGGVLRDDEIQRNDKGRIEYSFKTYVSDLNACLRNLLRTNEQCVKFDRKAQWYMSAIAVRVGSVQLLAPVPWEEVVILLAEDGRVEIGYTIDESDHSAGRYSLAGLGLPDRLGKALLAVVRGNALDPAVSNADVESLAGRLTELVPDAQGQPLRESGDGWRASFSTRPAGGAGRRLGGAASTHTSCIPQKSSPRAK